MSSLGSKSIFEFASRSDIIKILLLLSMIFVLLQFIRICLLLSGYADADFICWFQQPVCLPATPAVWLKQPWSLFTYFIVEPGFWVIVADMIWLWIFGTVLEDLKGPNRVLPVFLTGGVVGAILMAAINFFVQPVPQFFSGASPAIMAVAFAALRFKPTYRFWMFFGIGIPIWFFVLLYVGLHLASIQLHNLPHLYLLGGGILTGLLYTGPLASYFDWCTRLLHGSAGWLDNTRFIKKKTPSSGLIRPFKKTTEAASRMDSLLEKIHAKGMAALTDEERRLLDEYSRSSNETNP